jgi:hypothetical protein
MNRKLEQWRQLTRDERWLLAKLAITLPLVEVALRYTGLRRTRVLLGEERCPGTDAGLASAVMDSASAERLARFVEIASRHGLWRPTCLARSLVLCSLLRRRGLPAQLRIGVSKEKDGLRGHAWVELAGRVINDRATIVDDYAVYRDLGRLPPRGADGRDTG